MAEITLPRRAAAAHKHQRVAADLRGLVASLAAGDRLPPAAELERHFGVSTTTIEAAMEVLRKDGLIVRRRGSGTFVAERRGAVPAPSPSGNGHGRPARTAAPSGAVPAARRGTLAVFALQQSLFFRNCVSHLINEAAQVGLAVECRYTEYSLTVDDVLRFEALEPAAFVMVGPWLEWAAAAVIERGHRALVIGEPFADSPPTVPIAYADAETGGYLATRRLIDMGHRRIAFAHHLEPDVLRRKSRWQGHLRALREAGLLPADGAEPPTFGDGPMPLEAWCRDADAVRRHFSGPDAPTGVVAWTDSLAVQLLAGLRRAGLSVPGDVSVIGYDNTEVGEHCWPPLDTVDQHIPALVRHALKIVAPGAGGVPSLPISQSAPAQALVIPTLIERASCGPPRTGG